MTNSFKEEGARMNYFCKVIIGTLLRRLLMNKIIFTICLLLVGLYFIGALKKPAKLTTIAYSIERFFDKSPFENEKQISSLKQNSSP